MGVESEGKMLPAERTVTSDEIDLVDLGVALVRRWKLIVGITLAFVVLGVILALIKSPDYRYTATIQFATYTTPKGKTVRLLSPQTAATILKNGVIGHAIQHYARANNLDVRKFRVQVNNPQKSNVISLSAKGPLTMATAYQAIETSAAKSLFQQTAGPIDTYRAKARSALEHAKIELAQLKDAKRVAAKKSALKLKWLSVQADLSNLKQDHAVLLKKQKSLHQASQLYGTLATELKGYLKTARKNEQSSAINAKPINAMSSLLLGNQVQQNYQQLINMEQRLSVRIPQQEAQNQAHIQHNLQEQTAKKTAVEQARLQYLDYTAQHHRHIQAQQVKIKQLQGQLDNVQETQMIGQPTRSTDPVGLSRKAIIVVLAGVLGLFFALFVAVATGYISAVRRAIR